MTSTEYAKKLKDPRWQKRRLEIFKLANFTCQDCGSATNTLHAHHCYYVGDSDPWKYPDNCFRCLCEECHKKRHGLEVDAVLEFRRRLAKLGPDGINEIFHFLRFANDDNDALELRTIPPILPWPPEIINSLA